MASDEVELKCDCPKWWNPTAGREHHASCNRFVHVAPSTGDAVSREAVAKVINNFYAHSDHDQPSHCVDCALRHKALQAIRALPALPGGVDARLCEACCQPLGSEPSVAWHDRCTAVPADEIDQGEVALDHNR